MKDVKDIKVMVVDLGLFIELARTLGKTFNRVFYCNPSWVTPFPRMNMAYIGYGFPEIEVCLSPWEHFDDIDLYIFPDVGHGEMQVHLESMGKAVWGCRMAEELEFERDKCKKLMKKLDLPVGSYEVVKTVDGLRKYLKDHDNQFVKINRWRGHFETFSSPNYELVEPKIDEIEWQLGALKDVAEFICEDELKNKIESAVDIYSIDGELPKKMLYGFEVKDKGYAGCFTDYDSIPDVLKKFDKAFAPTLQKYGARTFYDPETRIGKDGIPYMVDLCIRSPSPPNELYQIFYTNLAEIIWKGANGECIEPEPIDKWGVEIIIHSSWACENWQPIEIPREHADYVKFRNAVKIDNKLYVMPQVGKVEEIGSVVGHGSTLKDAMNMAREISDSVKGYYIDIPQHSLEEAEKNIETAKEYNVWLKGEDK